MQGLELDHLVKRYGTLTALDDVSFTVPPGSIFGFVGANGAGKTTAMRIAMGVLAATSGNVRFNGSEVTEKQRVRFGYMPEERGLYPKMKVHEQIVYLTRLHDIDADAAEKSATEWEERLSIARYRTTQVEKLSLGNQQRVQLAVALTHSPSLLILDEPFSGLDPIAVETMSQALRDTANSGVPVLFSSHQLDLVERLCDRVGILSAGSLVACDTIENLRRDQPAKTILGAPEPALTALAASARAAGLTIEPHGDALLIHAAPEAPAVQSLAREAVDAGQLRELRAYFEPLSVMYRSAITPPDADTEPAPESDA